MSRFTTKVGKKEYAYGFDRPLQSYFFAAFNLDPEDEDGDLLFSVASSSNMTILPHPKYPDKMSYSNGELLELVKDEMGEFAPEEFLVKLALDLPIGY